MLPGTRLRGSFRCWTCQALLILRATPHVGQVGPLAVRAPQHRLLVVVVAGDGLRPQVSLLSHRADVDLHGADLLGVAVPTALADI